MASRPVSAQHLKAGADYLKALRALGLNPNFLGWGWDIASAQWTLVLVTSIIDAGGPLALNKLLFHAYNAEATPKEISPFIVRIFSSEIIPDDFYLLGEKNLRIDTVNGERSELPPIENIQRTFLGVELEMINSYQNLPLKKLKYIERRKAWNRFKGNVERLAA
ncbi:hypothetical protein HNR60_000745 [Rhodopseudomonas rhenobacensis]|uniref:Uncharacterized protein n=1 Tax=Rhodopseudomonas rhenobacensis TaxID=87461 RepID=A0A7W7Z142_9BRAD|nr:hypothetical protein [Rhodopseudomonas rhenobacensis]MBB5046003.1 hypothetical protein [Rhodopseudomonas rhenobacensis]